MMTDDNGWWYVCSINDNKRNGWHDFRSKQDAEAYARGETLYGGIAVVAFVGTGGARFVYVVGSWKRLDDDFATNVLEPPE